MTRSAVSTTTSAAGAARRHELESIAANYHMNAAVPDMHIENLTQRFFLDWFLQRVRPGMRVLEMGYGDGLVTAALLERGCDVTVVEGAGSLVERAVARHPQLACVHALFEEYEPGHSFDVVLASHVLEHVDEPRSLLRRVADWMDPDSSLIVAVPNQQSLHRRLAVLMGIQPALDSLSPRDHIVGHKRVYSFETLEADLQQAGLCVQERRGGFLKVLPNSMMLEFPRELLWALNAISPELPPELLANIAVVARKGDQGVAEGT